MLTTPSGRRWRSGRPATGAVLRGWPALRPDAPSAKRLASLGRPASRAVGSGGDDVGVLGEQLASLMPHDRVVWSTEGVDIYLSVVFVLGFCPIFNTFFSRICTPPPAG